MQKRAHERDQSMIHRHGVFGRTQKPARLQAHHSDFDGLASFALGLGGATKK